MITNLADLTADCLSPDAGRYPYYIVVPRYVRTSAGIRALHIVCHWLNRLGQSAYLLLYPDWQGLQVNPELVTPVLTEAIIDHHYAMGATPIVIYPEVLTGNPFNAPVRGRFIGNYPGLLGGTANYEPDEICFAFSQHLAKQVGQPENVLFVPVVDTNVFRPGRAQMRSGTCFYAAKFQAVHGGAVFGLPPGCVEIIRDRPDQLSPPEIADLFRKSELFYCFEDSALIMEAGICGCPVVMMKNAYFQRPLATEEAGEDGYAWGDEPEEVERARNTVSRAYDNYVRNIPRFFSQLHHFVLVTQKRAKITPYTAPIRIPGRLDRDSDTTKLRRRLGEALMELAVVKGPFQRTELLWVPRISAMGGSSNVTFISGWMAPEDDRIASFGEQAVLAILPPAGAVAVNLRVEGRFGLLQDERAVRVVCDDHYLFSEPLLRGQDSLLTVPIFEPGKPMIVVLSSDLKGRSDDVRSLGIAVRSITSKFRDQFAGGEPGGSAGVDTRDELLTVRLEKNLASPIGTKNCSVSCIDGQWVIEGDGEDPNLVISLGRKFDLQGGSAYLWGIYDAHQDGVLQVFVPNPGSQEFSEFLSVRESLRAGKRAFSISLPEVRELSMLRLDPFDGTGQISLSRLELLVVPKSSVAHDDQTRQEAGRGHSFRDVPSANLGKFHRVCLLSDRELPLADNCKVHFEGGTLVVEGLLADARLTFIEAEPVRSSEGFVFLSGICSADTEGSLEISTPLSGEAEDMWPVLAEVKVGIEPGSFLAPLSVNDSLQVFRLTAKDGMGALKFERLELLAARPLPRQ